VRTAFSKDLFDVRPMVIIDPKRGEHHYNMQAKKVWEDGNTFISVDPLSFVRDSGAKIRSQSYKSPLRVATIPARVLIDREFGDESLPLEVYELHTKKLTKSKEDGSAVEVNSRYGYLSSDVVYPPFQAKGDIGKLNSFLTDPEFASKISPWGAETLLNQRPISGTTQFDAVSEFEFEGKTWFKYLFHDTQTKEHTFALVRGDIASNKDVYTRVHSSCVTSETLGALDCDCRDQLRRAMEIINEKDSGVIFYCVQEGRGAGYAPKGRDRSAVQATGHQVVDLYETYDKMGLKGDLRDYRGVKDILHMFGFDNSPDSPSLTLISNNQTKLAALAQMGVNVSGLHKVPKMRANPYNTDYLGAKKSNADHDVEHYGDIGITVELPPMMTIPAGVANTHSVSFDLIAQYSLPTTTYPGRTVMSKEEYQALLLEVQERGSPELYKSILDVEELNCSRVAVKRSRDLLNRHRDTHGVDSIYSALATADWQSLKIIEDKDYKRTYAVLEYGDISEDINPMVYCHFESLDARIFIDPESRKTYRQAWKQIIQNGHGYMIVAINDGQGSTINSETIIQMSHLKEKMGLSPYDTSRSQVVFEKTRQECLQTSAHIAQAFGLGARELQLLVSEGQDPEASASIFEDIGLTVSSMTKVEDLVDVS
jgi:3,4-dihydroxy 2-butanone 4-phosphate synthase/GTP cyclohydrolase II